MENETERELKEIEQLAKLYSEKAAAPSSFSALYISSEHLVNRADSLIKALTGEERRRISTCLERLGENLLSCASQNGRFESALEAVKNLIEKAREIATL